MQGIIVLLTLLGGAVIRSEGKLSLDVPIHLVSRQAGGHETSITGCDIDHCSQVIGPRFAPSTSPITTYHKRDLQYITDISFTNPIQAAQYVQQLPYIPNNATGSTNVAAQIVQNDSDEAQLPWNVDVPFIPTANTNISALGGWEALPQVDGFNLNRSWEVVPGAIMPFYSTANIDPSQVKRAVITFPGK